MSKIHTIKIQEDGDDQFIEFPEEVIESTGWKVGDTLELINCPASEMAIYDDYIILRKKPDENSNS
jgi:bifunctional DNA-binding transcriptional regulator/antitoxin component of YhaV-PrlF toxin-antitoxin module